jgi:hypothetical protein
MCFNVLRPSRILFLPCQQCRRYAIKESVQGSCARKRKTRPINELIPILAADRASGGASEFDGAQGQQGQSSLDVGVGRRSRRVEVDSSSAMPKAKAVSCFIGATRPSARTSTGDHEHGVHHSKDKGDDSGRGRELVDAVDVSRRRAQSDTGRLVCSNFARVFRSTHRGGGLVR